MRVGEGGAYAALTLPFEGREDARDISGKPILVKRWVLSLFPSI